MRRSLLIAGVAVACTRAVPSDTPAPPPASDSEVRCAPFEPLAGDRLTVAAAREAYRWEELRRHVRYYEALSPRYLLEMTASSGEGCHFEAYTAGRLLFEHEYSAADGLGSGIFGARPTPFRRVHDGRFGGPETISCTSCHWLGGIAGAGSLQDNAFLLGDGQRSSSADARNPPALQGVGVVQALAQEMTRTLRQLRDDALLAARQDGAAVTVALAAKGISFGTLTAFADGTVDASNVAGVDRDLVIRPFGWKGTARSLREFVSGALQVHLGIQSETLVAEHAAAPDAELAGPGPADDPDADGLTRELTDGQLSALTIFLAAQEMPVIAPPIVLYDYPPEVEGVPPPSESDYIERWARGSALFYDVGCAFCHVPLLVLDDPLVELEGGVGAEPIELDLSLQAEPPRLAYDERVGGYPVWVFSDFKRHDLGAENASLHVERGVGTRMYLTRRLWGLADSAPYFYDGRAPSLDLAIAAHGGEAAFARERFLALAFESKADLRLYLNSLRRSPRLVVP